MTEQRNLILAIVLSVGIILFFQVFVEMPRMQQQQEEAARQQALQEQAGTAADGTVQPLPSGALPGVSVPGAVAADRGSVLERTERLRIDNGRLHGSISLTGGRLDDITLQDYRVALAEGSPEIELLSPVGSPSPFFAEFGWVPGDGSITVPDAQTVWNADADMLRANAPVNLDWENGQGLRFEKSIELDENYLFTLTRSVVNTTDQPVTLYPYALVSRWDTPPLEGIYILHEGPIGVLGERLTEVDYADLVDDGDIEATSTGGWIGITDKYWLSALIFDGSRTVTANFRHTAPDGRDRYQTDILGEPLVVQPGERAAITDRFFAGAKEVDKLDAYAAAHDIPLFDRAVDFGWFYFLTKPIFHVLDFFYRFSGNYGVAILLLTLLVKIIFFPLANKSYRAMSQMKKLQPEMMRLRERYENDKMKLNQELMALYKKEKVNPMAGCLPILIQIPVFFALYKVLYVSIEMRHAPFFGWIQDLSAPDPTSIFNLFGLLPFEVPGFLMIGVWPLLMGLTMYLQTKLNPMPADPMQARILTFLPLMFIFLFATFPAGLVIYWTWNNVLSIAQQWLIMKKMNVPVTA